MKYFDPCLNVPVCCSQRFFLQQFNRGIDHTCVCTYTCIYMLVYTYTCTCLYVGQYFHGGDSDREKVESAQDKHL